MPTLAQFRLQFPEFASTPDATILNWLALADPFFDQARWGTWLTLGVLYWVAHQIKLASQNALNGFTDDTTSQREGDVGFSRDSKLVNDEAHNPYLQTVYGQQYYRYARMVGAGAIAL
jgi:hypothetical protein